jgi:transposase
MENEKLSKTEEKLLFLSEEFSKVQTKIRRRKKKQMSQPVFKDYNQNQSMLLPPNLEELIPHNHLVRVVNSTIDQLKIDSLLATYKGGGSSAFHPMMLLKVLIYSYLSKVYSSRVIAKRLREDINYMWLSGMNRPGFRTINDFRSSRLKGVIDEVFGSMVMFLVENKYIDLKEYFVDGTKFRADNNKHKVIWSNNTNRYKEKVEQKIKVLLEEIDRVNAEENRIYGDRDLAELGNESKLTSQSVKEQALKLNEIIIKSVSRKQTIKERQITQALKQIEKKLLPKLEKYEKQQELLSGRNSYAKTDPDATVFRMKDGQLLPSYNVLVGTQKQFILNYSFHQQKASESDGVIANLLRFQQMAGSYPGLIIGDSAYGSEENYAFLEKSQIGNYLKYNTYNIEKKKGYRENPYRKENFVYDKQTGEYICTQNRRLILKEERKDKTMSGYETSLKVYQCTNCIDCPVESSCKRGHGNRCIQINDRLQKYRSEAKANLDSAEGIALRKRRGIDVEPVFGDIKYNQGYRRLRLRGKQKANVEFGLICMAHNTKKIANLIN